MKQLIENMVAIQLEIPPTNINKKEIYVMEKCLVPSNTRRNFMLILLLDSEILMLHMLSHLHRKGREATFECTYIQACKSGISTKQKNDGMPDVVSWE